MVVTLLTSQPLKFRDVRELQPLNTSLMKVTLLVFQLLKSKDVRELQLLNMDPMQVTLLVLKLLKSKDVREHSANIQDMSVTFSVFQPLTSMYVRERQL